jgi:hypothetical protein
MATLNPSFCGCISIRRNSSDQNTPIVVMLDQLVGLYEVWNKPEKAKEWRAKLPQTEAKIE